MIYFLLMGLLIAVKLYVKLKMGWCYSKVCLKGKTVIVTGGNSGIGYETALDLAGRGARVILACRNEDKAKDARDSIIKETHNSEVLYRLVDFTSLTSVRKFAAEIQANEQRLDILINNIGMETLDDELSEDGLLMLMQVNYFAPVLLTMLLLDMLKKTSGRIVNVASSSGRIAKLSEKDLKHLNTYLGRHARYPRSKLCNILFTIELASRLNNTGVTTYSLHPGLVKTNITRSFPIILKQIAEFGLWLLFKTPLEGAQTTIHCAVANDLEKYNGEHFEECQVVRRYGTTSNPVLNKKLWIETMQLLNIK